MALLPIPSGLITSNEFASVQGFNASGAPVVVPKTNFSIGGREVLTADRNYYVRTDGNDSNTGLENTAGGAFLTIQKAVDVVCSLDTSIYQVIIYVADGNYIIPSPIRLHAVLGAQIVKIIGNSTTPSNVKIFTCGIAINTGFGFGGGWDIDGIHIDGTAVTTSTLCINVVFGNLLRIRNLEINNFNGGNLFYAARGGILEVFGTCKVTGSSFSYGLWSEQAAYLNFSPTVFTLVGTPAFTGFFAVAKYGRVDFSNTTSIVGTATGPRYFVEQNGIMNCFAAGANRLPGSVAGSVVTGGQYV